MVKKLIFTRMTLEYLEMVKVMVFPPVAVPQLSWQQNASV